MTQDINLADEIKKLIELQDIDSEIYKINTELEDMPHRLEAYDEIIKDKERIFKDSEEKFKKVELERKQKEMDLKTKEDQIKKQQGQLFQIKTNKEYAALEKEIGSAKADNSILEEDILKLFDKGDEVKKEIQENKKIYDAEKSKIEAEKKTMEDHKKEIEKELTRLEAQRSEFTKAINKNVLNKYERILNGREGLAMAHIEGDACGGCNMNLPPQVINEAKLKKELIFCGNCSRILYSKE